ncbi:hypothetical protein ABZ330_09785 [Streptomyces sp. NPDC006172]
MEDLVIRDADVVDGSGGPSYRADEDGRRTDTLAGRAIRRSPV